MIEIEKEEKFPSFFVPSDPPTLRILKVGLDSHDLPNETLEKTERSPAIAPNGIICDPYIVISPQSKEKLETMLNAKPNKPKFTSTKSQWIESIIKIPKNMDPDTP